VTAAFAMTVGRRQARSRSGAAELIADRIDAVGRDEGTWGRSRRTRNGWACSAGRQSTTKCGRWMEPSERADHFSVILQEE